MFLFPEKTAICQLYMYSTFVISELMRPNCIVGRRMPSIPQRHIITELKHMPPPRSALPAGGRSREIEIYIRLREKVMARISFIQS